MKKERFRRRKPSSSSPEALYKEYIEPVTLAAMGFRPRNISPDKVEEIVHDTLTRLCVKPERIRQGSFRSKCLVAVWRGFIAESRRQQEEARGLQDMARARKAVQKPADNQLIQKETIAKVHEVLDTMRINRRGPRSNGRLLRPDEKQTMLLWVEGLTNRQIAARTERSVETVKKIIARTRPVLRKNAELKSLFG